jgi:L-2,4-diaminobutyrate decarboxylase
MSLPTDLGEARRRIRAVYDPQLLRAAGHRLTELLADHLTAVQSSQGQVLPWVDPPENVRQALDVADGALPLDATAEAWTQRFGELVEIMLSRGNNLHDPRYIGHQVPAPVPLAGLFDAVGSVTNQVMAIYEMGPWSTSVERAMIQRLGEQLGWHPGDFSGLVTHGGSLANLTALLTARNVTLGDCWECGVARPGLPPVLVVHQDVHYGVSRAAGIMGLGTNQVVRVGLDDRRRMDPQRLEETLRDLRAKNQPVVAVVACACATPIGAFDPLPDITDVCRRYGVWLHVDAAHGGSAMLSARYRHLVDGLGEADSLIWDAHKMLFVPGLCAFVFYKNAAHRFEAFRQDAPYLFDPTAPGLAEYDSGLKTVECTKRAAVFGLWGVWSLFGPQLLADLVDVTFSMGRTLYEKLSAQPDFVPLHEPQCNIVVFRHVPAALRAASPERLGQFQFELRRRLIQSGEFYIVATRLNGVGALRVTIINPLTGPDHLDRLLDALREQGQQLLAEVDASVTSGQEDNTRLAGQRPHPVDHHAQRPDLRG